MPRLNQLLPQDVPSPQKLLKAILTFGLKLSRPWPSTTSTELDLQGPSSAKTASQQDLLSTCSNRELSCQTKFYGQDRCCFNFPGGQMLQTQFWDADPVVGPEDSWTIHGLW